MMGEILDKKNIVAAMLLAGCMTVCSMDTPELSTRFISSLAENPMAFKPGDEC
jgi:hypothetical protein